MNPRTQAVIVFFAGLSIVAGLLLFARFASEQAIVNRFHPVDASVAAPAEPQSKSNAFSSDSPLFFLAVAPIVSPESSLVLYRPLAEYLGAVLGREGRLVVRERYRDINDLMREKKADMAFVCTNSFLEGEREEAMAALAIPVMGGRREYYSQIIVSRRSPARSLAELKSTRFGSADAASTSGWIYPAVRLLEMGEDPRTFFREHVITGSHDKSVQAVADGLLDGAAVDNLVLEQFPRSIQRKVRIIETSPSYGMPPFCVHPELPKAEREALAEALFRMHESPGGRAILAPLLVERFAPIDADFYDSVRRLREKWEKTRIRP